MATGRPPGPTTADLLRAAAVAHPDREAYVHGDHRVTYSWLDRAADGFGTTLLDLGVHPGDVVCLLLPSSIEFAVCYLGALRVGAITSAINLRLGPAEKAAILERTEPEVTVLGDGVTLPATAPVGRKTAASSLPSAFAAEPSTAWLELSPTDPACIVWTSGTTGEPKGAVYDHERMAAISRNIGELTRPGDRRLFVLPFPHVGFMTRMWDELANATTMVLVGEPWSAEETLRLLREERITMATGVPTQWSLVLAHPDVERTDLSGLRVAAIGGAAVAPELVRRMRTVLGCPVLTRYTSTEAGTTTSTLVGDDDEVVATTVGRPAPEVELRISGPDRAALPTGEVGEIWCRSPTTMRGYWRDADRTAEVLDGDGWLHTGDLGFMGDDDNLRIVGRLKEMYIRGGYNVYPAQVEGVLAEHPAVERAAVVGVPDPVLGEIGVAFVVLARDAKAPTLATLRAWCRERLADYKAPDGLEVVDELPVNSMLKVDKSALAQRVERQEVR